jgi:hypothetical protein
MNPYHKLLSVLTISSLFSIITCQGFDVCEVRAEQIWTGNDTQGYSPEQIQRYLYHGHVAGMNPDYNRSNYITLTLEGKSTTPCYT